MIDDFCSMEEINFLNTDSIMYVKNSHKTSERESARQGLFLLCDKED
jgi:hypothetical protein